MAEELGVEGVSSFAALVLGDLTLVTEIPEVLGIGDEELAAWRPARPASYRRHVKLRYTGPLFADQTWPIPERVERFLSRPRREASRLRRADVDQEGEVVKGSIRAVRAANARVLAVSTVHELSVEPDDDVCVEPFLPSLSIMLRVDLAVTAGGQGSVQTAMSAGTPLLGVPLQPEQDVNRHLAEKQGQVVSCR